ncbi:hypothetical protein AVEN_96212-1 [Araneus ventricosus]|uniref:Uncharacterized protein n=1 Tax=Araneus ventricosus TaxID=182803 RepID=A0A4Y2I3L5_ARAVE|nr:hypothetical protein AVEN_96212-1 [Araneus ventricosus]
MTERRPMLPLRQQNRLNGHGTMLYDITMHHDTANACRNVIPGTFSPRISARFSRLAVVAEGMGRAHYLWTTPVVGAVVLFRVLLPGCSWVSEAQKGHLCTITTQYLKNVVSFVKKT